MIWLLALACSPTAESEAPPSAAKRSPDASAARVEVAVVDTNSASSMTLNLPGEIEGSKDVVLSAALGGQVERVPIGRGERVAAGQVIARVDAQIYSASVDQALAQNDQAKAEYDRIQRLGDLASETQVLSAHTAVRVTDAGLRGARAQYARAVVTAPFSGVAADVFPSRGEFLGPGSPVARLVQLDPARVTLAVADKDVVMLEPGMPVTVRTAAAPTPISGNIAYVGRAADARTRSFPVEIEVPNKEGRLLPGMIATVQVERPLPADALTLPQDWIVTRRAGQGVFRVRDGVAVWTPIELGQVLHDQVVVTKGLERGERIVIAGHRDLVDGDAVLISREGVCCTQGRPVFGGR